MAVRPRRGRSRTNDPEAMRRRVVEVAAARFQQGGYHASSMHAIMAEAGVTGGALYHHFRSKKSLALAVIRDRVRAEVRETWIDPVLAAPTALAGVRRVFAGIQAGIDRRGAVDGCPLSNLTLELATVDPDFRREIQRVFTEWRQALAGKLRADVAAGRLHKIDPEKVATLIIAAYSGAMAMAKAEQGSRALRTTLKQLLSSLAASVIRPG